LGLAIFTGISAPSRAGQDTTAFLNAATSDFQSIANFVNGPFMNSLGFFTGLGWNTNPTVYDLVSGPHFSLSVAGGADFITMPNLANLNLPVVSASSAFSLPSGVPLPFPVITGRIGLFNGFDAGFRYTYLPPINAGTFGGNFNGWGIDLRYKIFDGMTSPTVTLSTSFDTMTGTFNVAANNISETANFTGPSSTNYPSATLTGNANYALNWVTRSVGAKITIGKNIGVLYPYAAVGFQRNSGSVSSTISGSFSANLDGAGTSNPSVVSTGEPTLFEPKYVVGLDLGGGPGLQIAAVGESNGTDVAGTLTLAAGF
jgi:hypothetical protein